MARYLIIRVNIYRFCKGLQNLPFQNMSCLIGPCYDNEYITFLNMLKLSSKIIWYYNLKMKMFWWQKPRTSYWKWASKWKYSHEWLFDEFHILYLSASALITIRTLAASSYKIWSRMDLLVWTKITRWQKDL